ncbi:MAG: NADH:ubiquinone reductase (Na(+)-transporting) subunit C [Flavobacteriales bacterium]|nr:NADH:ubiquinone reductase (Na(+)-transporting) subunit C [Flavobacteriales bacterium]
MALNRDSNVYTITFATIMVVIVGGLLAYISMSLKPIQKANISNEKMQNILQAIGIEETDGVTRDEAGDLFNQYVKRRITINYKGEIVSDKTSEDAIDPQDKTDAFNIDLRKEYSKFVKPIMNKHKGDNDKIKEALAASTDIHFPIFICENNGKKYYVVSASGKGLWDDIWGYIGLNEDASAITGSVFDHKGETPGLGSKINEDWFQDQFVGKTIEENGEYAPIKVMKPGNELNNHQVDGISGATFTGVGVNEMLARNLEVYYNFFKNNKEFTGGNKVEAKEEATTSENTVPDSLSVIKTLAFTGNFAEDFDLLLQNYESILPGEQKSFVIEGIEFSAGSANINQNSSKETLNRILEGLKNMPGAMVELSGHTDNKGEEETLLKLSENRANAVKTYLVENGIETERIQAVGYGASMPIGDNETDEGRTQNRRTEIKIVKNEIIANVN